MINFNSPTNQLNSLTSGVSKNLAGQNLIISGDSDDELALFATFALENGANVILLPSVGDVKLPSSVELAGYLKVVLKQGQETSITHVGADSKNDVERAEGTLTLYTSGSSGIPKHVTFTAEQLSLTTSWYGSIYSLSGDSLVISSLPSTYNFLFIAGALSAKAAGCTYKHISSSQIEGFLENTRDENQSTILIANPILVETLASNCIGLRFNHLLVDTGGAPMSCHALSYFREHVADIREGYGLTETCSLTHFDSEGTSNSLGTVGKNLPGVECMILPDLQNRPRLWINSPNLGRVETFESSIYLYDTGDLASIDSSNRLRILGRSSDCEIGGAYPRDTLDLIGPALHMRCALVQHLDDNKVSIKVRALYEEDVSEKIITLVSEHLKIPRCNVEILDQKGSYTHSLKLTRVK